MFISIIIFITSIIYSSTFFYIIIIGFGFPNCTSQSSDKSQTGPFRTEVVATPGVCNLADGNSVNSGSWTVNCPGKDNNNNDGTLFFCSDNNCNSCSAFPFKNTGSSDTKVQCYNTNQGPPGAQSFTARCEAGNRAEKQAKDAENNGVKEILSIGVAGGVALAVGVSALL